MNLQTITDDAPGTVLFPEYAELYELIAREVTGLTDTQLDFSSDQWAWADWSIRRQLSHMASLMYGWMIVRLGPTLFPDGNHGIDDIQNLTAPGFDRRLDDRRYQALSDLPVILHALQDAIAPKLRVWTKKRFGGDGKNWRRRWRTVRSNASVGRVGAVPPLKKRPGNSPSVADSGGAGNGWRSHERSEVGAQ